MIFLVSFKTKILTTSWWDFDFFLVIKFLESHVEEPEIIKKKDFDYRKYTFETSSHIPKPSVSYNYPQGLQLTGSPQMEVGFHPKDTPGIPEYSTNFNVQEALSDKNALNRESANQFIANSGTGTRYTREKSDLINMAGSNYAHFEKAVERVKGNLGPLEVKFDACHIQDNLKTMISKTNLKISKSDNIKMIKFRLPGETEMFIDVADESFKYRGYTQVSKKLRILVKWLAFVNIAVFGESDLIDQNSNEMLSNWLSETFSSLGKIIPLQRVFQPWSCLFGEAHKLLLQKLALRNFKFQQEAFDISCSIVIIWYRDFQPEIWRKFISLNFGLSPEKEMINKAISKALDEKIMVNLISEGFDQCARLEDVKIPKIDMFPKSMKPERIYGRHDIIFTEEENAIKKQLQRIYKIRDPKKL
jgi:hypothetical protein